MLKPVDLPAYHYSCSSVHSCLWKYGFSTAPVAQDWLLLPPSLLVDNPPPRSLLSSCDCNCKLINGTQHLIVLANSLGVIWS
jgi:hypothetical protein